MKQIAQVFKYICFIVLLLLLFLPAVAGAAEVRNLTMQQSGEQIILRYDLVGRLGERKADVTVVLQIGAERHEAGKLTLKGDFGRGVALGRGKRITWDVLKDFPAGFEGDVSWDVTSSGPAVAAATATPSPSPPAATTAATRPSSSAGAFTDATTGMEFVFVKGGCYEMGDTFGDGEADEKPVHEVCLDGFSMGKYEVTQGQWKIVMGSPPPQLAFKDCGDNCPVERVSWNDIQEFIGKLNRRAGKSYRLPTEAEWEYAARSGGKREKWAGTSDESSLGEYAWYDGNSGSKTHPVGQKRPNALGLYDMTGNVWEWCQDWYGDKYYANSSRNNPQGPDSGTYRVLRGGSWIDRPWIVRAADRNGSDPANRGYSSGFRLVLPAPR